MPLATPTGLTITRLWRRLGPPQTIKQIPSWSTQVQDVEWRAGWYELYADLKWSNAEEAAHQVEVEIAGFTAGKMLLPQSSTSSLSHRLGLVWADKVSLSVTVKVRLVGAGGDSAQVTATLALHASGGAAFGADVLTFDVGSRSVLIPAWTGIMTEGRLEYAQDGFENSSNQGIRLYRGTGSNPPFVGAYPVAMAADRWPLPPDLAAGAYTAHWVSSYYNAYAVVTTDAYGRRHYGWEARRVTIANTFKQLRLDLTDGAGDFAVTNQVVQWRRGVAVDVELLGSHAARWELVGGAPAGFGVVEGGGGRWYLRGTPLTSGALSITVKGVRLSDDAEATGTIAATITDAGAQRTRIVANPGWLNNGLAYSTGDEVIVALASIPAPATWRAVGLPAGLQISTDGRIYGRPTAEGRFIASLYAQAEGTAESDPVMLTFTIRRGSVVAAGATPQSRLPWLADRWELTDLQVFARGRQVESTLAGEGGIRWKVFDTINWPVFFVGADDAPFPLEPEELRLKIRPANNLDASLIVAEAVSPVCRGGRVLADIGEEIVAGTVTGAGGAARSGGGEGESDLIFAGMQAGGAFSFAFKGGTGGGDFELGELVEVEITEEGWRWNGEFRVAAIDAAESEVDPWIVLERPDPDPYYLLETVTGQQERATLLEWVEDAGKNEAMPCVGELEWRKGGKLYSSRWFNLLGELDAVRPG